MEGMRSWPFWCRCCSYWKPNKHGISKRSEWCFRWKLCGFSTAMPWEMHALCERSREQPKPLHRSSPLAEGFCRHGFSRVYLKNSPCHHIPGYWNLGEESGHSPTQQHTHLRDHGWLISSTQDSLWCCEALNGLPCQKWSPGKWSRMFFDYSWYLS